jgi:hypothetical protein
MAARFDFSQENVPRTLKSDGNAFQNGPLPGVSGVGYILAISLKKGVSAKWPCIDFLERPPE